jgi:hypothetical protein
VVVLLAAIELRSGADWRMSDPLISLLERLVISQESAAQSMIQVAARLDLLIQAMAEDDPEDPDAQPLTYMDGSPCR